MRLLRTMVAHAPARLLHAGSSLPRAAAARPVARGRAWFSSKISSFDCSQRLDLDQQAEVYPPHIPPTSDFPSPLMGAGPERGAHRWQVTVALQRDGVVVVRSAPHISQGLDLGNREASPCRECVPQRRTDCSGCRDGRNHQA